MAITIYTDESRPQRLEKGNGLGLAILTGHVTDSAYATGGTSITAITNKFANCLRVICDSPNGFMVQYDKTNKKLKIYATVDTVAGTRIEVGNAVDISATCGPINFIAIGRV